MPARCRRVRSATATGGRDACPEQIEPLFDRERPGVSQRAQRSHVERQEPVRHVGQHEQHDSSRSSLDAHERRRCHDGRPENQGERGEETKRPARIEVPQTHGLCPLPLLYQETGDERPAQDEEDMMRNHREVPASRRDLPRQTASDRERSPTGASGPAPRSPEDRCREGEVYSALALSSSAP
jgi:hypothetical protein